MWPVLSLQVAFIKNTNNSHVKVTITYSNYTRYLHTIYIHRHTHICPSNGPLLEYNFAVLSQNHSRNPTANIMTSGLLGALVYPNFV